MIGEIHGMPCPTCEHPQTRVIDTRLHINAVRDKTIPVPARRRRRECTSCFHRFTTYETIHDSTPTELEDFLTRVVRYRQEFEVELDNSESVYEAMAATV